MSKKNKKSTRVKQHIFDLKREFEVPIFVHFVEFRVFHGLKASCSGLFVCRVRVRREIFLYLCGLLQGA